MEKSKMYRVYNCHCPLNRDLIIDNFQAVDKKYCQMMALAKIRIALKGSNRMKLHFSPRVKTRGN